MRAIQKGKVLVTAGSVANSPRALEAMRAAGHEVIVTTTPPSSDQAWINEQVKDIDALVFAMEPVNRNALEAAQRLRVIARPGVGFDSVDIDAATERGVIVTVAAGTNHESVADFTFGLMLQAMRGLTDAANNVRGGGWQRTIGTELWSKTLAVVGFGRIGQAVVKRARGFDMKVLVVSRSKPELAPGFENVSFVSLDEALAQADILSLHAPLTDATANMVNAESISRMKPGAFIINTSRGGLIDEAALADAVKSGRLGGTAVDVLCKQGAGSTSPLIGVPGIIVTPHMATFSRESIERVAMSVARSVVPALEGRMPEHTVNPQAWDAAGKAS